MVEVWWHYLASYPGPSSDGMHAPSKKFLNGSVIKPSFDLSTYLCSLCSLPSKQTFQITKLRNNLIQGFNVFLVLIELMP